MAVNGIGGTGITGTLGNAGGISSLTKTQSDSGKFENMVKELKNSAEAQKNKTVSGVASSSISQGHRLNGDYTQGFYGTYTSQSDKAAAPRGFASNSSNGKGKKITIDRTSDLYVQSMEMENYLVKTMLSSMRSTIEHTDLSGSNNSFARDMYEDMMYDNLAESLTKNAGFGLADQIYIELSGQR